ncbi:hypothetical protein F5878DRAFT_647089, partial [Lentinula raphanica]
MPIVRILGREGPPSESNEERSISVIFSPSETAISPCFSSEHDSRKGRYSRMREWKSSSEDVLSSVDSRDKDTEGSERGMSRVTRLGPFGSKEQILRLDALNVDRGSQASNSFQARSTNPGGSSPDFSMTSLAQTGNFCLPTPSPSPPRSFQDENLVQYEKPILDSRNMVGVAGRGSGDTIHSDEGVGETEGHGTHSISSRKRKRPTVTSNEDEENYSGQSDFEDNGNNGDDENDGDYVDASNRGGRGGRGSRGSRGSRGNGGGRGRGGRGRGGGGNCSRNGANVTRRRTGQNSNVTPEELEDVADNPGEFSTAASVAPRAEGSTDAGVAAGSSSNNSFVYSPNRAAPSQQVQQDSTLLLLSLSCSPDGLDWVGGFVKALEGQVWADCDALISESLKNLALRCSRSKNMDVFATFCRMLNKLMFAAKVNSIIHAQQRAFPSKTPSIKGIVNTLKQDGFSEKELGIWMSAGTRWARIAGAASIYALILIAEKRLSYRWGREMSSAAVVEACHQMRSPSNQVILSLVKDGLIPIITELQKAIAFTIPVLFSYTTREIYSLPSVMNIAQVEQTDWYFDLFYYRIAVNVPRNQALWKDVIDFVPSEGNLTSFYSFNQRHLNSSSNPTLPAVTAWDIDEGPLSDDEMEDKISAQNPLPSSVLPPVTFCGFAGEILKIDSAKWEPLYIVKASFNSRKVLKNDRQPFSAKQRDSWTEKQRKIVVKGERPKTLKEFSEQIQQRYDQDTGAIKAKQKWLFLTQEAIGRAASRREVKVVDAEDKTLFTIDSTLPEEQRHCLRNAIVAFCYATSVELQNRDTSELSGPPIFQVWHLSYYARFGQSGKPIPKDFHPLHIKRSDGSKVNHSQFYVRASKDLQVFGKEFVALSEAIGEILQNIVEKRIARDPDLFGKDVEAMVDIMPLHDFTPVRPFMGLVVNINS